MTKGKARAVPAGSEDDGDSDHEVATFVDHGSDSEDEDEEFDGGTTRFHQAAVTPKRQADEDDGQRWRTGVDLDYDVRSARRQTNLDVLWGQAAHAPTPGWVAQDIDLGIPLSGDLSGYGLAATITGVLRDDRFRFDGKRPKAEGKKQDGDDADEERKRAEKQKGRPTDRIDYFFLGEGDFPKAEEFLQARASAPPVRRHVRNVRDQHLDAALDGLDKYGPPASRSPAMPEVEAAGADVDHLLDELADTSPLQFEAVVDDTFDNSVSIDYAYGRDGLVKVLYKGVLVGRFSRKPKRSAFALSYTTASYVVTKIRHTGTGAELELTGDRRLPLLVVGSDKIEPFVFAHAVEIPLFQRSANGKAIYRITEGHLSPGARHPVRLKVRYGVRPRDKDGWHKVRKGTVDFAFADGEGLVFEPAVTPE